MMGPALPGTVNTIPEQFLALRGTWFAILFEYANDVFLILALIEVGLSVLLWMVYRHDAEALGLHMLKKVMYLGFMYAICSMPAPGSRRSSIVLSRRVRRRQGFTHSTLAK